MNHVPFHFFPRYWQQQQQQQQHWAVVLVMLQHISLTKEGEFVEIAFVLQFSFLFFIL